MTDDRFERTRLLLGEEAFSKIQQSHVTVVGLGAVGYSAAESMVRYGLGKIRLVDFDMIRKSNINRQMLALESTLGQLKVDTAQKRLLDINPNLIVELFPLFFHEETFEEIFKEKTDIVVDAIDSFKPKLTMLRMLKENGIAVVSSMGAARKTDPGAIRVGDISETTVCRLASRIRKDLHKYGIYEGIRCVYSIEASRGLFCKTAPLTPEKPLIKKDGEISREKEYYERGRTREPLGSISYITSIFGAMIAYEVLHHLTESSLKKN